MHKKMILIAFLFFLQKQFYFAFSRRFLHIIFVFGIYDGNVAAMILNLLHLRKLIFNEIISFIFIDLMLN